MKFNIYKFNEDEDRYRKLQWKMLFLMLGYGLVIVSIPIGFIFYFAKPLVLVAIEGKTELILGAIFGMYWTIIFLSMGKYHDDLYPKFIKQGKVIENEAKKLDKLWNGNLSTMNGTTTQPKI